ncbi:MAG: acyl-CoA thioesterase [Bacteroidales bacterium]|nr:acyl-CoA thioesterase [Bacteroidales bacterium]
MDINLSVFKHSVDIQIRFGDIDRNGHVSNTVYPAYYDFGKVQYFNAVLGDMDWGEEGLIMASIKTDYLKPVYLNTKISVLTRVACIGNKSLNMEHCIVERDTGVVMSVCTTALVCFDYLSGESIPVPERWRENIKDYERNDDLSAG